MSRSIISFGIAMLLALTTTAHAQQKVDWSDYIEKRPAATAKQPAKAAAVTRTAQPTKTTKAVAKAPAKAKVPAKAKPARKK